MTDYIKSLAFLARCGVEVKMLDEHLFEVGGFYKSGTALVDTGNKTIITRYDSKEPFEDWRTLEDQLLEINYLWWERSKDRYDGWRNRDWAWVNVAERLAERDQ